VTKSFAYGVFWIGAVAFAAALSCNPARHAIRQKELIDEAIAKWVLENPVPMSEIMIPGDTLIFRDTAFVDSYVFDTVYLKDTVRITKTAYKTIREIVNVRDTVVRTVNNTEAIIKLQEEKNLLQGRLYGSEASQDRQRWWLILLSLVCCLLLYICIKRR
jgi:hypothetical protein